MPTSTPAKPVDAISIDPNVTVRDSAFVVTGTVSSSAGVASVTFSDVENGPGKPLGTATLDGRGGFTFALPHGASYDFVTATETDGTGGKATATLMAFLDGNWTGQPFVATDEALDRLGERTTTTYFRGDGSVQSLMVYGPLSEVSYTTTNRDDGGNTVKVQSVGIDIPSNFFDTFQNGSRPDNTFVFDPGYGLDVVRQFRPDGGDHDTLSLASSDFASIADVLRHTQGTASGAVIHDPTSGDTIRLPGVSKAQLVQNSGDIAFHP